MKVEKKKMGRPRKENPNTTVYSFKISQKQLKKLKAYALLTGKTTALLLSKELLHAQKLRISLML